MFFFGSSSYRLISHVHYHLLLYQRVVGLIFCKHDVRFVDEGDDSCLMGMRA